MEILTVKEFSKSYLVNGATTVLKQAGAKFYEDVQAFISNGGVVDDSGIVESLRDLKLQELDAYYNAPENQIMTMNDTVFVFTGTIQNTKETRDEVFQLIKRLEFTILGGDGYLGAETPDISLPEITESTAEIDFHFNTPPYVAAMSLLSLRKIYTWLCYVYEQNYHVYHSHYHVIKSLATPAELEAFDVTANFVFNRVITLAFANP